MKSGFSESNVHVFEPDMPSIYNSWPEKWQLWVQVPAPHPTRSTLFIAETSLPRLTCGPDICSINIEMGLSEK